MPVRSFVDLVVNFLPVYSKRSFIIKVNKAKEVALLKGERKVASNVGS